MATEYFNDAWRIPNNKNQSLVSNYSMEFDASSGDTIQLNNAGNSLFNNATAFTISAWINPLDTGAIQNILTNYGNAVARQNVMLRWSTTEALQFYVVTTSGLKFLGTVNNLIQYNQWQHIVATYDGINSKIYYNGTLSNSIAATGVVATSTEQDQIGWRAPYGQYFNGKMDQVCVFDYALSASQVSTLYGGGTAVTNPMALSPKPVAYYQLGDQSAYNGANYLVPNNSLQDYVFNYGYNSTSSYTKIQTNDLSSLGAISVTTWFKYNSGIPSFATILQLENNIWIPNWSSTSQIRFQGAGGTTDRHIINTTFEVDRWYHLTLTYNGTSAKCYIDGDISKGFDVTAGNLNLTSSTKFNLGSTTSNANRWDGFISNTAMFNYELTSSQATLIYNNGTPSDLTSLNPIGWWKQNVDDIFLTNATAAVNFNILDYGSDSNNGEMLSAVSGSLQQSDLQHTSGYSPYALSFDGTNQEFDIPSVSTLELYNTDFSISFWCKVDASVSRPMFFEKYTGGGGWSIYVNSDFLRFYNGSAWTYISGAFQTVYAGLWTNVTVVGNLALSNLKCYINGNQVHSSTNSLIQIQNTSILTMAGSNGSTFSYAGGLSNVAIWSGTALSAAEVTEVYNQGVPINLNTFSGNKPNHWWQLGSNSSYNPNPTGTEGSWTCLDEGISASTSPLTSAVSTTNMANDDITNGVGYSGNGLGTSSIEIIGDAPYSTANGISENMDVLDRTTDVPS